MNPLEEISCPVCGKATPYNRLDCKHCGSQIGSPNVNKTKLKSEIDALHARYKLTCEALKSKGLESEGKQLEDLVTDKAKVVINIDLEYLHKWVSKSDFEYMPYSRLVDIDKALIASPLRDAERSTVESMLYGSNGRNIVYGAVSVNGLGLFSLGRFSVTISEAISKNKTSYIEFNSYKFHTYEFLIHYAAERRLPSGHLAAWQDIYMLAVIKNKELLSSKMKEEDLNALILKADEDKRKDWFIEAHIFGNLTVDSIEEVRDTGKTTRWKNSMTNRIKANDLDDLKYRLGSKWKT